MALRIRRGGLVYNVVHHRPDRHLGALNWNPASQAGAGEIEQITHHIDRAVGTASDTQGEAEGRLLKFLGFGQEARGGRGGSQRGAKDTGRSEIELRDGKRIRWLTWPVFHRFGITEKDGSAIRMTLTAFGTGSLPSLPFRVSMTRRSLGGRTASIGVVALVEHGRHGSDVAPLVAKAAEFYLDRKYGRPFDPAPTLIERIRAGGAAQVR